MCCFEKNTLYLQSQTRGKCFSGSGPRVREQESGRSSVRLEYTSGGRVVAGSNPVTPTDEEA